MLTYVVTGGAGFIGANLVELLLAAGHRVLVLDALTYAGNAMSLAHHKGNDRFSFVHGSIADPEKLAHIFSQHPDGVFHLAAESHVDRSIDSPSVFVQTNVVGTFCLLEATLSYWRAFARAKKPHFRFLNVSTDEVFGSLGSQGFFTEASAYAPSSPYSATKAAADHLVRAYQHTYALPTLVTNCSNNYGPYQFPEKLIPHMFLLCLRQLPLPLYGSGKQVRDWLHVHDHGRGLIRAMEAGTVGETYLFGGAHECSNLEIVTQICTLMDQLHPRADHRLYGGQIVYVEDRPGHDARCAIDASKSQRDLGWSAQVSFSDGLRQTVEWYLKNPQWVEATTRQGYTPTRQGTR